MSLHLLSFFAVLLLLPVLASRARAAACGDDVAGDRIACACGDTVVASTRLLPDDPVVARICSLDGLTVRAAPMAESILVDLAGLVIRGSGVGVGVRIAHGGADGAILTGGANAQSGAIVGFGTGLLADAGDAVARVSHLELRENRDEGVRMRIAGTLFQDVVARDNHGDGFSLRGTGGRLIAVRSHDNARDGVRLFTTGMAIDAIATENGRSGFLVDGRDNDLSGAVASDNQGDGIVVRGSRRTNAVSAAAVVTAPPDQSEANP